MLQIANAFFKLPGDYLKPGEEEISGMRTRLNEILAPNNEFGVAGEADWEIGDCLAQWWRPNFETFMVSGQFPLSGRVARHGSTHKIQKRASSAPVADLCLLATCSMNIFVDQSKTVPLRPCSHLKA